VCVCVCVCVRHVAGGAEPPQHVREGTHGDRLIVLCVCTVVVQNSSHLYVTEAGENEDIEANEDIYHDETKTEPEMVESLSPDLHRHPKQGPERHWDSFPCQHCEKCFTSRQGVEQHMHTHALEDNEAHSYKSNKSDPCFDTNVGQLQHEKLETADMQLQTSSSTGSNSSILSGGDCSVQADKHRALDDHQAHSKCCEKIFTTYTNKQQHECRIHRQHLQLMCAEKTQQEENLQRIFGETSQQETQRGDSIAPAAVLENEGKHTEQYMLDIPSNISENLSFYIDGKIVSTSTVSSCEAAEVHSGSSTLVGLDALILDPTQISQVLNTDSITCKEVPGQPPAKRRTATPPLLPQIKTELESEVVASSCSSSLVSSLIENLLPQSTESSVVQKERTVFLSPKLKQLLEKQDGLKPTLALIADGQKPCSPVSLSVLPAGSGRFKRRTGSPTSSPQQNPTSEETATPDMGDFDPEGTGQIETPHVSPVHPTPDESDRTPSLEEPAVLTETWPPMTGGNSCNQQPLDLSNAVKRNEDVALADSVLDLSLQKKSPDASELTLNLVSQTVLKEGNSSRCMMEKVIVNTGEQSVSLRDSDTPLVTDFAIVTSSDMVTPVETPASPCTIAFASPVSHTMLPTAPSLITVLAPPPVSDPTNQPIQVLGPNLSPKPLVICTENALNSSELPNPQAVDPTILVSSIAESVTLSTTTSVLSDCPDAGETSPAPEPAKAEPLTTKEKEAADGYVSINNTPADALQQSFTKNFICNVCDKLFHSMKELGHHVGDHADEWPYKCEFCVLLFGKPSALLDHRTSLHGVGKTYVCSACTKEFVYLCNLKQHQEELHPGQQCTYTEEEKGKLRPQNYNNLSKVNMEPSVADAPEEPKKVVTKEEGEVDMATEELFTTIKVMASDGGKVKGPDVRLGINQHYPSFKPPPFPYHNRSPAGSMASATNFTTHNIPQTFSTAIRCTKCGKSFDNMPELHKHILACANASDKRRYTPKKNPIPLRHFAKAQNGVLSTNRLNGSNRASQSNKSRPGQESPVKLKFKVMTKRKKKLGHRVMPQRNKSVSSSHKVPSAQADEQHDIFVCPHCNREFTMRRSRTKHMAVCPKKLKEVKKRKEGGISVTKENHGHLHRGVSHVDEKQQDSPQHKTRLQTSGPTKRPSILPVQTVFANKRSKIIIKESMQPKQETPTLSELPIVRTFNPAMRQYSRVPHNVKGIPIKITIVKPQQIVPQKDELPPSQSCEEAMGAATSSSEQSATA
uniref:PR domain containing 2, with ZNF domain a n=1 Tax=Mastacembelus armatus TaxID=205130 RepID=A0A7N8X420_9TELE